ncbi:hypothetical protein CWS31_006765 [Colwellia echini]|uniref:LVIVD repeat-containing protein n=2 Tax=Colwellia echini TaxID=1982103 RepID=A0ABY3MYN8_9GAMM|nr:hypothetical protein CWS31_006765 [Colwellia echini]
MITNSKNLLSRITTNIAAWAVLCVLFFSALSSFTVVAAGIYNKVAVNYSYTPPAPKNQTPEQALQKSTGCLTCHTDTDSMTMHESPGVILGCTDCHGGNSAVIKPFDAKKDDAIYTESFNKAHVLPSYPADWNFPASANPQNSYTLLNRESPEYVRFVNPSDLRVAEESCGACHMPTVQAAKRSIMATGAMLYGAASYANNILPYKNYILGEAYTREGEATAIAGPPLADFEKATKDHGVLPILYPLPKWQNVPSGDIFRVFERGGRNIINQFPETAIPNSLGQLQRLEEPGRPDIKQSNRGNGTGGRISVPLLNTHKTRLNDPLMWFLGTNDNPGDFRTSGCGSCHVVYANDREPRHSGPYAEFGHTGQTQTVDPTIAKQEDGHPIKHVFSRAIPTSQCMSCHMHQPNMFMNTFLGYTMWDYEADAPAMFPKKQKYPTDEEKFKSMQTNPEGAAVRGLWSEQDFLRDVWTKNDEMNDTQFADYHGHGWNFRAVFKKDRKGNLLDKENEVIDPKDPQKFDKSVHMSSVHLDVGMHCVDCHFSQDNHGNGHVYGEVAGAVEIDCVDCHGTVKDYPSLKTSGPAAPPGGTDLSLIRNPDGKKRFEWKSDGLYQRSLLWPDLEWKLSLLKDVVDPKNKEFNAKAARSKMMAKDTTNQHWGTDVEADNLAHSNDEMECYTCHQSWTTSCGGCHLPIEANWKTESKHYEGGESRNYASYNPQVVRDQIFMLGRRGDINGGKIAPIRSTSGLVLSSTNSSREKIYVQQPPISASGYSSQAMNPHFAHTVRKEETRVCSDCHLSKDSDNNAIFTQTLGLGTDFIDFIGYHAYVGGSESVEAVQVTEWEEPQAVIGSYLQKYVYPDFYQQHIENEMEIDIGYSHSSGQVNCMQLRGEYLYAAAGEKGMVVYDVASIANKGVSQRIITSPASSLGQDTTVESTNATCVSLVTTQPVAPERNQGELMRVANQEKPTHPIYTYALITDAEEGLILTNIDTLADGEPRNNFLTRALTWNENDVLKGAKHITVGGRYVYIIADAGLVVLDLDNPLKPKYLTTVALNKGHSVAQQFRYLFVTDADGLKTIDITEPENAFVVTDNTIKLEQANRVFVSRTFAYVAAGKDGLAIVDITKPESMKTYQVFNANGKLTDAQDVVIASTNASLFAYIADGAAGLKVVQLTSPESQPRFYGFSPDPKPVLIAWYPTSSSALSLSRGLERDRAVDETGGQVSVFSRLGSGPLTEADMKGLYLDKNNKPWFVEDTIEEVGKEIHFGVETPKLVVPEILANKLAKQLAEIKAIKAVAEPSTDAKE